jgi:hypothetical protein
MATKLWLCTDHMRSLQTCAFWYAHVGVGILTSTANALVNVFSSTGYRIEWHVFIF